MRLWPRHSRLKRVHVGAVLPVVAFLLSRSDKEIGHHATIPASRDSIDTRCGGPRLRGRIPAAINFIFAVRDIRRIEPSARPGGWCSAIPLKPDSYRFSFRPAFPAGAVGWPMKGANGDPRMTRVMGLSRRSCRKGRRLCCASPSELLRGANPSD